MESTPAKKPLKSLTEEQRQFLELRKSRRREARGLGGQSRQRDAQLPLDIFGAKPLGIFTPDDIATKSDSSKAVKLETWDKCQVSSARCYRVAFVDFTCRALAGEASPNPRHDTSEELLGGYDPYDREGYPLALSYQQRAGHG